jgi:tetratricopeptide (TPR) repeat protein
LRALALFESLSGRPGFDAANLHFHCGWSAELAKRDEAAITHYRQVATLAAAPALHVHARFREGWIRYCQHNTSAALLALEEATHLAETHGINNAIACHAEYWYAVCLEQDGRFIDALRHYRRGRACDDLHVEAAYREILCLIAVGLYREAVEACDAFLNDAPPTAASARHQEVAALVREEKASLEKSLAHA